MIVVSAPAPQRSHTSSTNARVTTRMARYWIALAVSANPKRPKRGTNGLTTIKNVSLLAPNMALVVVMNVLKNMGVDVSPPPKIFRHSTGKNKQKLENGRKLYTLK
jgi:hypothetical protein